VDDLADLMKKLNVEKAILCGLSMGGYIALRFAVKYQDKVMGLVLCDTRSEADGNEAKLKRAATIEKVRKEGVEAFAEDFVKAVIAPENMSNKEIVEKVRQMILDTSRLAVCGTSLALASRLDTKDSLDEITVPTLVMVGEDDAVTPPIAAQTIHEGISGSKMALIPKAGHMSNLENPQAFNKVLMGFLSKLSTGGNR
jgi:3-oxoadipate enol-lactonase